MEEWPADLVFLQDLEELMKCPICFDFMKAPVLLPDCDHNYCSLCIRRYFSHREQCPTCGSSACSNQLRSNGILEKTIEQFKKIRSPLQSLCINKLPQSQTQLRSGCDSSKEAATRKRNLPRSAKPTHFDDDELNSSQDTKYGSSTPLKLRSRPVSQPCSDSDDSDVQILSEDENGALNSSAGSSSASKPHQSVLSPLASLNQPEGQKPRNVQSKLFSHMSVQGDRGRTRAKKTAGNGRELTAKTVCLTDASAKAASPGSVSSGQSSQSGTGLNSSPKVLSPLMSQTQSDLRLGGSSPGGASVVEKVPCPVCGVPVVTQSVNRHLDLCLGRQEKQSARKKKRKSLPKLVYNLLTDKDIRKRLKDLGLNTKGDRQVLIKRHHEFTLYHNADCDSLAPKDMNELVKEFEDVQKLQMKLSSKSSASGQSILCFKKDSKQEDIDKAHKDYAAQHKDQFKSLIKEARSRMKSVRKPRSSSASAAPAPENNAEDCAQEESSQTGTTSESAVEKKMNCFVIDESEEDDEVVGRMEEQTTSETKKTKGSVIDDDFDECDGGDVINDKDVVMEETLELGVTSENITSKTKRSCVTEDSVDDVSSEEMSKPGASKDSAGPSQDVKTDSLRPLEETELNRDSFKDSTDSGDDASSEVFDYDLNPQSVQSQFSVRGRGKRALRPSKPSWQDTDLMEMSLPPSASSPSGSRSEFHKPNPCVSSDSFHNQEKNLSGNSQPVNSTNGSHTVIVDTSQALGLSSESGPAVSLEGRVLHSTSSQAKRVDSLSPKSHTKCSLTQTAGQMDCNSKDSPQLSDEYPKGEDKEGNATESSIDSETDSDPTHKIGQDMSKDVEELTYTEQEGRKKKRTQRGRGRGRKDARRPRDVRRTVQSATNSPSFEEENVENHQSTSSSGLEVNLNDSHSDTNVLSENEEVKHAEACETTDHGFDPGTSSDCCMKDSADCFELNLSDCEDEDLSATQEQIGCASLKNETHLQNDQGTEVHSKGRPASKNSSETVSNVKESDFLTGNTDSVGETNLELPVREAEQEIDLSSNSCQVTGPKSLLKKCSTTTLYKKSVRFSGLRARISDIQDEECGHNILKKKTADFKHREQINFEKFGKTSVTRNEAVRQADKRMPGCQEKIEELEKVYSTEHSASAPLETASVHEISECAVSSEVVSCPQDRIQRDQSRNKQKKRKNGKRAFQTTAADSEVHADVQNDGAVDDAVESQKTCAPVDFCEPANFVLEKKHDKEKNGKETTTKRRKKQHSTFPTSSEDFTCSKMLAGEQVSDLTLAHNSSASDTPVAQEDWTDPQDHEGEICEGVTAEDNKSRAECQTEKGSTELINSPARSTVKSGCAVTEESQVMESSSQNFPKQLPHNAGHSSEEKYKNRDPEPSENASQVIPDNSADIMEQSVAVNHLKNKNRRKRTCSSVGKDIQPIAATQSCMQQTSETERKRRKTSQSHCSAVVRTIADSHVDDFRPSSEPEQQQQQSRAALETIPESCSDIPGKPSRADSRTRKRGSVKFADDTALTKPSVMPETELPSGEQEMIPGERKKERRGRKKCAQ